MSNKTFTDGLDRLTSGDGERKGPGRPIKNLSEIKNTSQDGLHPYETRATFILPEPLLEKIKGIAYWDRRKIRSVHTEAIRLYVEQYEKTKGPIQPIPKETE
jgi:hypothetical protein